MATIRYGILLDTESAGVLTALTTIRNRFSLCLRISRSCLWHVPGQGWHRDCWSGQPMTVPDSDPCYKSELSPNTARVPG